MRSFLLLAAFSFAAMGQQPVLWRNPGNVAHRDLFGGPGGRAGVPRSPFKFISEDKSGSTPKVIVRDVRGRRWTVKFGDEVKSEVFASRMAWAVGYYAEPLYYVRSGRIAGARKLGRADKYIDKYGRFRDARFEYHPPTGKFLRTANWTWKKNPFVGTPELNGLKLLLMLTSNWDNKDARDPTSNTGIIQQGGQWIYLVTDWGASMGNWGNIFTRSKWNCNDFADQSPKFIREVEGSEVKFGFTGQHDGDFKNNITLRDLRWLLRYLRPLTDAQIRSALAAAGANRSEQACFTAALRYRIGQLQQAAYPTVRARLR